MVELILLNITYNTLKSLFINGAGLYQPVAGKSIGQYIELQKILPYYPQLKLWFNYCFTPLKPALYNLNKNICFLDIDKNKNITSFILGCDWCSIVNGVIETAKQNIIKTPKLIELIDFEKLKSYDKYLDFCLVNRIEKLTNKQIEKWCEYTFGKININLLIFSQLYLKFEIIELRWCPFKRSKEFYYRNKDKRYLEPTEKMIYEVGKILSNYETITCNNCPKIINKNWKYTKSNKHSIFQPFLDYMIEEINKSYYVTKQCFITIPKIKIILIIILVYLFLVD